MKTKTNVGIMVILTGVLLSAPLTLAQNDLPLAEQRQHALAEATANRWDAAEPVLAALAAVEPVDVQACALLSRHRLEQKNAKEAVELVERAAKAAPDRSDLQAQLGCALAQRIGEVNFMQQGMLAGKMRAAFEKAVALDPDNVVGWIGLAQYFANAPAIVGGSFEKAEGFAIEVEKRDPYQGAFQRALIDEKRGDIEAAAEQYRRAGTLKPQEPWAFVSLGQTYARAGRREEAKAAFQTALQRRPECTPAQKGLTELDGAAPKS